MSQLSHDLHPLPEMIWVLIAALSCLFGGMVVGLIAGVLIAETNLVHTQGVVLRRFENVVNEWLDKLDGES